MSYEAKVFRILIASPSDVEDEREMVAAAIQSWNDLHSAGRQVVLLPLRWETHSAPEYGVRPQEVINRAIVNDCDLLVGIFWTRIGSPTGVAESGTLEEIDRVGKAGKPVMLYFSRIPIDPEGLDLKQVEKLKEFKQNTYPQGLVESYKSIADFREKISRQLEMKVRELQAKEQSGPPPLTFSIISTDTKRLVGSKLSVTLYDPDVRNLAGVPPEDRSAVEKLIRRRRKINLTQPIIMGFENAGSVAIRNLFAEITMTASEKSMSLSDNSPFSGWGNLWLFPQLSGRGADEAGKTVLAILADYESEGFRELDGEWRLAMKWDAIQPQRFQLAKPTLYLSTDKPGTLQLSAKLYSDSFSAPYEFRAEVDVAIEKRSVKLEEMIPNWKDQIRTEVSNDFSTILTVPSPRERK